MSLEQRRRLQTLSKQIKDGQVTSQRLLELRSIMALEQIGTPTARAVLEWLGQGDGGASLTQHARLAMACAETRKAKKWEAEK